MLGAGDQRVGFISRQDNASDFIANRRVRVGFQFSREAARVDIEQAERDASAVLLLAGHVENGRVPRRDGDRALDRMEIRANGVVVGRPDLHRVRVDVRGDLVEQTDEMVSVAREEHVMARAHGRNGQLRMKAAGLERTNERSVSRAATWSLTRA